MYYFREIVDLATIPEVWAASAIALALTLAVTTFMIIRTISHLTEIEETDNT